MCIRDRNRHCSAEGCANGFLERAPGFGTVLALPLGIETGLDQGLAERFGIRSIENQPLLAHLADQVIVHLEHIGPLLDRHLFEMASHFLVLATIRLPSHTWPVIEQYFCTS